MIVSTCPAAIDLRLFLSLESTPKIVDFELWMALQGKFKHVGLC